MNTSKEVVRYAEVCIDLAAKSLVGKSGITKSDVEDAKSEMMLDVIQRLPKHDETRWSYKTFISHIVKNKAAHILRDYSLKKAQTTRCLQSLDASIHDDSDAKTLHDLLSAEDVQGERRTSSHTNCKYQDMCIDLADVISRLSDIQQKCCRGIIAGDSICEIAEQNNIPRHKFYLHVIGPIRRAFKSAGLEIYLN